MLKLIIDDFSISTPITGIPWTEVTTVNNYLSLSFDQLSPNATYEWQVQGLDCDGEGSATEWSETAYFTTYETFTKDIAKYTDDNDHYYLLASPVGTVNPEDVDNMLSNSYDLYRFDQSQDLEWRNHKVSSFDLEAGKGYLYANSGDGENGNTTLSFTGAPYTDGTVTLIKDDAARFSGWNLIGNPLSTAATIDKPFYRMNDDGSALSAQVEANNTVAAMEGVFVQATQNGETATFTPATRSNGNEAAGILTIGVTQVVEPVETPANGNNGPSTTATPSTLDRAIIRFDGGQTLGKFTLNADDTKLYIPQSGKDYAVVSAGNTGELPVNFKATKNGRYTLSFSCEGVSFSYLHLIDNLTGADVDLLASPSYTFDAKTTDYASRFKLIFATGPSTGSGTDGTFAFYDGNEWIITEEHAGATVQIIDVMGRIVYSRDGVHTVSINQMAPGVYVMRLINGDDVKTQKIIVR